MKIRFALVVAVSVIAAAAAVMAGDPTVQELLDSVGIKPSGTQRGQMDTVGFVTTGEQMDGVVAQSRELAAPRLGSGEPAVKAAVCPHDDYYYAGRLYALLMPRIKAKTVVLFGVFHKARVWDMRDKLVFDSFETWRGPYGPVKVSPIREDIIARLSKDDYVVDNDMQQVEHSVEAIVPWLQAYNRDVEIVSILVPYMHWDTMDTLAGDLSRALATIIEEKGWRLGEDVCLIASADAVHYGDSGWGGGSYAMFGTDIDGYDKAVQRDRDLANNLLAGTIEPSNLEKFLYTCVDRDNVMNYKWAWCGRFSVPFGLNVANRVKEALAGSALIGEVLDYGTSVSEASLDLDQIEGLGTTAPNNLRHWVGYPAIAYH